MVHRFPLLRMAATVSSTPIFLNPKQRVSPSCAVIGATKPDCFVRSIWDKSLAAYTETGEVAISSAEQLGETSQKRRYSCAAVPKRHTTFLFSNRLLVVTPFKREICDTKLVDNGGHLPKDRAGASE